MKAGQSVVIYHDPITQNVEEGIAKLVELVSKATMPPYEELWIVLFKGDDGLIFRTILPEGDEG